MDEIIETLFSPQWVLLIIVDFFFLVALLWGGSNDTRPQNVDGKIVEPSEEDKRGHYKSGLTIWLVWNICLWFAILAKSYC
jgi:hypothetical protein